MAKSKDLAHWDRGYIQVYTGNGRGKTAVALGLAIRAAGAGLKVFFAQFLRGQFFNELSAMERFADRIVIKQYGRVNSPADIPTANDIQAVKAALADIRMMLQTEEYMLVILDEANLAIQIGMMDVKDLLALIDETPGNVELVITGQTADPQILERANLITEMNEIKNDPPAEDASDKSAQ